LIQSLFDKAYQENHEGFKDALLAARDYLGAALARVWSGLSPHYLDYEDVGIALLKMDHDLTGGEYRGLIRNNFLWRDIGFAIVGARLSPPATDSHAVSVRTVTPSHERHLSKLTYCERMARLRQSIENRLVR
jgi:hypothetical protein